MANRRINAFAAELTPPGIGGIATIAVVGRDAWKCISPLFRRRRGQPLAAPPEPGALFFGTFGPPPGDEIVLAARDHQNGPWYELHCHGGPQVVDWILEQLTQAGASIESWKKVFSMPAPTLRSIALRNLTKAMTLRTANVLLDQSLGALDRAIGRIIALFDQSRVNAAADGINRLLRWASLGRHLTRPWTVAVCGPPNVGKSSIINALAGYRRSVVTATPGTTRDVVGTLIALDGWPVELLDTAGVRDAEEPLENEGIRRGLEAAASSSLVLWVMDISTRAVPPPRNLDPLIVVNKVDLSPHAWNPDSFGPSTLISALKGEGITELGQAIMTRLIPTPPSPGEAVPFNDGLGHELKEIRNDIAAGRIKLARSRLVGLVSPVKPA